MSGRDTAALPVGFRLVLDTATTMLDERTVAGGYPSRVIRLSPAGIRTLGELCESGVRSAPGGRLARYLTDAGLAHPYPLGASFGDVTVVVPVRDDAARLDRCLSGLDGCAPVVVVDDASADAEAVAVVADRHRALLIRRAVRGGPAAAREEGLRHVSSEFVAFVDSDCVPGPTWLFFLLAHFTDPLVGAVAPRIVPADQRRPAHRYARRFGALDLGGRPALVRKDGRVRYVPTAALLVRCTALESVAHEAQVFDTALRYGEDVDLVWRLGAAGWRVRYDPVVSVAHDEPAWWRDVFLRRLRYGTSAAALSLRHPDATAHVVIPALPAATVAAVLARRPVLAAALVAAMSVRTARATRISLPVAARMSATGVLATWRGLGRYACQFLLPLAAILAALPGARRRRRALVVGLLTAGGIDSVRYAPARVADHAAYGAGVVLGCVTERSLRPLRPVFVGSGNWRAPGQKGGRR